MGNREQLPNTSAHAELDAVIVGAGFAGLYMLYRLRNLGFSVRVFEAGSGIGGTWYWNRYPGARCDVESVQYSYQFSEALQQEWEWTERYATQPEILRYANHVADRFDLRKDIQLNTRVSAATFDEARHRWTVVTDDGNRSRLSSASWPPAACRRPTRPSLPGSIPFAARCITPANGRMKASISPASASA
jgi:cyclohexanone monooxygenase